MEMKISIEVIAIFVITADILHFAKSLRTLNSTPSMKSWTCNGRSQRDMVEKLISANIIKSNPIKECMIKVDRANFVRHKHVAYEDTPQSIGYGATISAPHMHAHALEEIYPVLKVIHEQRPDEPLRILDVGCGSGFLTTCFGYLLKDSHNKTDQWKGTAIGIDYVPELVNFALSNIMKADSSLIKSKTVSVHGGDGWKGFPDSAPFHAIHVGAAAESLPKCLLEQLSVDGIMIIPVGPDGGNQSLYKVLRIKESDTYSESDYVIKNLLGVRYVPLVRKGQS